MLCSRCSGNFMTVLYSVCLEFSFKNLGVVTISRTAIVNFTPKKINSIRKFYKRVSRIEIASKRLEILKNRFFSSMKPLQVLSPNTRSASSPTKLIFRFRRLKIGFVKTYETFKVLCLTSWFGTELQ